MKNHFKKSVIFLNFIFSLSAAATGPAIKPYEHAPLNGFTTHGPETQQAQSIHEAFHSPGGAVFRADQIKVLEPSDFVDMEKLSHSSMDAAAKLITEGKLIAVESTVGNAVRLGNPPGGKGAVVLGEEITFLDAKVIRWAVESAVHGTGIPLVLWTSDENKDHVKGLLKSMEARMVNNPILSDKIKQALKKYLHGRNITLMAHSVLLPVINEHGQLAPERLRNLGAGELVPVLHASGVAKKLRMNHETVLLFSNIDFDPRVTRALAAFVQAPKINGEKPNLMQVHVPTTASGGSAYRLTYDSGKTVIMPIEGVALPNGAPSANTLNTNTVIFTGAALDPATYQNLPLVFEKKVYNGVTYHLPKLSLSDVAINSKIVVSVALGDSEKDFFTGSKDMTLLNEHGPKETHRRIGAWNRRLQHTDTESLPTLRKALSCSMVLVH